jgi:hypothetical protein
MEIFHDEFFRPDLTTLTLNNNCLTNTLNTNQNVLNIPYSIKYSTNETTYSSQTRRTNTRFITGAVVSRAASTSRTPTAMQPLCDKDENCRGFDLDGYLYSKISYPLNDSSFVSSGTVQGMRVRQGGTPILGTPIFRNSLNFTNVNSSNIDGRLIFSYIHIPTTQFYKFRIRSGTTSYNFPCKIYLNNYQNIIINSFQIIANQSTLQQESPYDVINAGIYLICIDLPLPVNQSANSTVSNLPSIPFTLEFSRTNITSIHPDLLPSPTDWSSCDSLLIKKCSDLLTKPSQLVDLFFNSSITYCNNTTNRNTSNCINFYNSIETFMIILMMKFILLYIHNQLMVNYPTGQFLMQIGQKI